MEAFKSPILSGNHEAEICQDDDQRGFSSFKMQENSSLIPLDSKIEITCNCKEKILVVDDNNFNLSTLVLMIKNLPINLMNIKRAKIETNWESSFMKSPESIQRDLVLRHGPSYEEEEEKRSNSSNMANGFSLCSKGQEIFQLDKAINGEEAIKMYQ